MNLQKSLGESTVWMSLAASSMSIVSFIVFVIISRILSPDEIGLVVFAILVVETGRIVINGGLSVCIVQREKWENDFASTSFYISLIYSAIVTLIILFIGVPLTKRFYDPMAVPILQALSIIFIMEGMKVIHEGKLRRELRFKTIAIRSIISSIVSSALGITLALKGFGAWALVAQQISSQLIITMLTLIGANWWPERQFSFIRAREATRMASPMMLAQIVNTLSASLVEFMVGILISPLALGIYRIAGRALFILQEIIIRPLEQTTMPVLARMENASARADATLRILRINSFIIVPIFFGTAAIGEEFIDLAFGTKWHSSGELMGILALGSTPFALRLQINSTLTAEGKSHWVLINMIATLIITFAIGYLLIPYGVHYAAIAYAAINYLSGFSSLLIFKHIFNCSIGRCLNILWPSHLMAGIMLLACLIVKSLIPDSLQPIFKILLIIGTGLTTHIILCTLFFRKETRDVFHECIAILPRSFSSLLKRFFYWARMN